MGIHQATFYNWKKKFAGLPEALVTDYKVSVHRGYAVTRFCRSMWYYKKVDRDDQILQKRIKEIAEIRVRYGCERILILLRLEVWKDNHKSVYRLYKLEGLNLRSRRPKRNRAGAHR